MTLDVDTNDPTARAVVNAIQTGDLPALKRLLSARPNLATARIEHKDGCARSRTPLHIATDWPGHFPNGPAVIAALVQAGADVNARFVGPHNETPLHWAASSNDVVVLDALIDAGADIEAVGGVSAVARRCRTRGDSGNGMPHVDSSSVEHGQPSTTPPRWD